MTRLVPGFLKRTFIRFVRFLIRHPVALLVHPLEVEVAELRNELIRTREGLAQDLVREVREGRDATSASITDLEHRDRMMQASIASFELALQDVDERAQGVSELRVSLDKLRLDEAANRAEIAMQRARLEMVLREARKALPKPLAEAQLRTFSRELEKLLDESYEDFENAFRGTRDVVRARQKAYVRDIVPLRDQSLPLLDIGCGRGEWLELLRDHGVPAYGVDTNEAFVKANVERRLDARVADALEHLRDVPESSLAAITAFHVIEHLEVETFLDLVDSALRALRPEGLLILETPNPTNLTVGASTFYIDPTHAKPVHPLWLEFTLSARGFVDVDLRYLHRTPERQLSPPGVHSPDGVVLRRLVDHANEAFFGPEDYAAFARKPARDET